MSATALQALRPTLKKVPAAVVRAAPLVSAAVSTVGNATVPSPVPAPLILSVQVLAVTAPVKVMVPSDAIPVIGVARVAVIPAAAMARLTQVFMLSSKVGSNLWCLPCTEYRLLHDLLKTGGRGFADM